LRYDQLGATAIKSYDYMFKRYYERLSAKFIDFSPNNSVCHLAEIYGALTVRATDVMSPYGA